MKKPRGADAGQILIGVVMLLVMLSILVPAMVLYTQRESRWTAKQSENSAAFHLADAGIEKAYLTLSLSTATWVALQEYGTAIAGFKFDTAYLDVPGGEYAISITSGPGKQQATVISVGRDTLRKESRALKVLYSNIPLGDVAVFGGNGVDVSGQNMNVEWGAIISPQSLVTHGALHPTYWSAGNIDLDPNGAAPPNCDTPNCWWWHSYYSGIPPAPTLDFSFYKSSAQASGAGPCGNYYQPSDFTYSCNDTSGKPYYVEGNMTFSSGYVLGSVIVIGNFSTPNGNLGGQSATVLVPTDAWKQYPDDWSHYTTNFEPSNPYSSFPGLNSSYLSPSTMTYTISSLSVNGLLYVGGDFIGPNGGGNSDLAYGIVFVKGAVTLNGNSHVTIYYGAGASSGMQLTRLVLNRSQWVDAPQWKWPSNLN